MFWRSARFSWTSRRRSMALWMTRIVPFREMAIVPSRSGRSRTLLGACLQCVGRLRRQRQRQREAGPLADGAVAPNRPVVLVHDAVGDREPKAGAAPDGLGGE